MTRGLNPLSSAGVDALPLRVVFKNSTLRNSFFAPLLTANWVPYLYWSPSKPSLWSMPSSLEICVPSNLSPRLLTFSATADRRSPFADGRSHIVKLSEGLWFLHSHSKLPFAFHFPIHDFQRHQEAINRHCRRLEAYFRCLVDRTVQGDEHCEIDCSFSSSFDASALALGEGSRGFALDLYPLSRLQIARARGFSHRRRNLTLSELRIYTSSVGRRHSPWRIYVNRGQRVVASNSQLDFR